MFKLKNIWSWLIDPIQTGSDSASNRKGRLLASILALLIPFGFLITIAANLFNSNLSLWHNSDIWLMTGVTIILAVIYRVSRTKYYTLSASLTIAIAAGVIFLTVMLDKNPRDIYGLFYLILPVLLASIFLSTRAAIITACCNAAGILIFLTITTKIPAYDFIFGPFSFVVMASIAIILATHYWNLLERDRRTELAHNEERYRAVVEQSTNCIFLVDLATKRILEANSALHHLLGYNAAEMSKLTLYDFVAHDRASIDQHFEYITTKGLHTIGERQYRRKDGSLVDVEAKANLITYGGREAVCVVTQDITDRKEAQLTQEQYKFQLEEQVAARTAELTIANQLLIQGYEERTKALASQQASEEQFRRLVDTMNEGFVILDPLGTITYVNDKYGQMFGYTNDELIGLKVTAILDETNQQILKEELIKRPQRGQEPYELTVTHKSGTKVFTIVSPRSIIDAEGNFQGSFAVLTDITRLKQAETALQASEEQFRLSFELAPIGMALVSLAGEFLRVNQAYCDMISYAAEELIGRPFAEVTHPDDLTLNLALLQQLLQGAIPHFQMEKRYISKLGKVIYALLRVTLVYDPNQTPLHFIAQTLDITERKQAEEALQQTNERLSLIALENARLFAQERQQRQIAESFREVMLALNSSLDQNTVLTKILEQLSQVIASDSAGIFLQKNDTLVLLADTSQTSQDIGYTISLVSNDPVARVFNHKLLFIIADVHQDAGWEIWEGGEKIRGWMGAPLLVNNQPIGVLAADSFEVGTFRDEDSHILQIFANQAAIAINNARLYASAQQEIAERKQAEEALKQTRDHALLASRLKTELLAKVSHELRTPLGAIIGFAEMLESGIYGHISLEQRQALSEIIDSSHYLTGMVNELLNQAQLEAGRLNLQLAPCSLASLVGDVLAKVQVLAKVKGLTLQSEIAADMPTAIMSDPVRLRQILVNLVSNAIKFTVQGSIRVKLYRSMPAHWILQVIDTGVGIPPEAQAFIFEPFRQVDGSLTRRQSGTGLGLSIVKQLTELMGGQITVESQVGQGSTFTILLPLIISQEPHHELT